jgi:DAK2 domain fusion protein YloV
MITAVDSLSGPQIRDLFQAATAWLEAHVDEVNAVNVFPVPDGDTGTNMFLTMRSTMQEAERCAGETAGEILAAMALGALMGARGNSGVILSQIIRGIAEAGSDAQTIDAGRLVRGLEEASLAAYRAVSRPTEGTILTVVREASEAARARLNGNRDLVALLETVVEAARNSVDRTPALLPVLAEAGVVDAGGLGLAYLLEGMLKRLKGEPLQPAPDARVGAPTQDWLEMTGQRHATEESLYGYCTEVLIGGQDLDPEAVRSKIAELGDSVLVVGDERLVRVHVHTDDPGAVLSVGTDAGQLVQVKVDNIRRQAEDFIQMHEERPAPLPGLTGAVSTVAVIAGGGMQAIFESVGCTRTVSGGTTMNPSAQEILDAVQSCPTDEVVVLPNDKNIILAAEQAAGMAEKTVRVVHTRSMPQGLAALLAVNPEEGVEENVAAMEEARSAVRTIEVARAVRSTSVGGVEVREGQVIAIVDDELKLAAETPEEAVKRALAGVAGAGTSLVTLYYGAETREAQATALAHEIRSGFPDHDVEVVRGGQPHYQYIVSVE